IKSTAMVLPSGETPTDSIRPREVSLHVVVGRNTSEAKQGATSLPKHLVMIPPEEDPHDSDSLNPGECIRNTARRSVNLLFSSQFYSCSKERRGTSRHVKPPPSRREGTIAADLLIWRISHGKPRNRLCGVLGRDLSVFACGHLKRAELSNVMGNVSKCIGDTRWCDTVESLWAFALWGWPRASLRRRFGHG